ncbi:MAG: ABC transporter ATP-binding protein [Clostridiales bacterium]|nr:ABC transporter ATP-binding protein [Clostridiales bacterium]
MIKILKYLKPYAHIILLCVVLIFGQAMADLKLPDIMSDIVNTGIQNSGIKSVVPDVIDAVTFDRITDATNGYIVFAEIVTDNDYASASDKALLSPDDIQLLKDSYTSVTRAEAAKKIVYDGTLGGDVYIRKGILDKKFKADEEGLERVSKDYLLYLFAADTVRSVLTGDAESDASLQATLAPFIANLPPPFLSDLQNADLFTVLAKPVYATLVPVFLYPHLPAAAGLPAGILPMIYNMVSGNDFSVSIAITQTLSETYKAGVDTDKLRINYIWQRGLIMLLIALASAASVVIVGFLAAKIAARFARDIRKKIFEKVESFSNHEIDKFTTASLITRSTNDISQIQQLIMFMIRMIFYAPMIGFGAVYYALSKAPDLTWLNLLSVGILVLMVILLYLLAVPRFKLIQKLIDRLNLIMRENLSGMMVIRAFNKQEQENQKFDKTNKDLTKQNLFVNRIMIMLFPAMTLLMSGLTIVIVWIGADRIVHAEMTVGNMMAFIQYAMQIVMSFLMISVMFIMVPRASVSAKRISDVLETEPLIKDGTQYSFGKKTAGKLAFENVSFKYEGAEVSAVSDISFNAEPGKVFAVIGTTGSGKSTLVNLMPRFYDVTEGRITLDGVDIRELSLKELRDNISIVPQKSILFSGTVATNLRLADANASEEGMYNALSTAQISDFVTGSDNGLGMNIAQGGQNVSGGQKQRLSIARALTKDAPVLVFDDSFSALDFKTDARLRHALKLNVKDRTVIIVAQRIGTIKDADEILVLDEGKIAGKGTHKYLMENCSEYREIAFSQLNKEELL